MPLSSSSSNSTFLTPSPGSWGEMGFTPNRTSYGEILIASETVVFNWAEKKMICQFKKLIHFKVKQTV